MRARALVVGVLLGFAGAAAAAGHSPFSTAASKVQCKLPGVHYSGTTAQKQKVCLTLSANGKALKEYSFGARFKCDDGTRDFGVTRITPDVTDVSVGGTYILSAGAGETTKKITDIGKLGKFDGSIGLRATGMLGYSIESTFSGQIKNRTVAGVLRQLVKFGDPTSPDLVCDSRKARWSARRAAG